MFKYVVFYTLSIILMLSSAARAAANCDQYTVMPGDTLRLIAERYYGTRDLSPIIYEANIAVVGADPNTIEIGMRLAIPCRDDIKIPLPTAFLATIGEPESNSPVRRFLAKTGDTPFMSSDGSGIIPDILGAALRKGGYRAGLEVERVGSNGAILRQSSQDETTLLSFPWVMPDCGNPAALSPQSEILCQDYEFSVPLYEITLGLFVRSNDALARAATTDGFAGKSFCIPQFHNDDLLRRIGVSLAETTQTRTGDFGTCVNALLSGNTDVIVADYQSLATYYDGEASLIADIPAFAWQTTMHAIASTQNPEALNVLEMANNGMRQILASGEWFAIVKQHMPAHVN